MIKSKKQKKNVKRNKSMVYDKGIRKQDKFGVFFGAGTENNIPLCKTLVQNTHKNTCYCNENIYSPVKKKIVKNAY